MPKKKASRPLKFAPLQRVVAEEVTDPDELARMDEVRKRLTREYRERERKIYGWSIWDRPFRIAPLQRVVAEEITDPAEIAAIEKVRKRLTREYEEREALMNGESIKKSPKKTSKRRRPSKPEA